MTAAQLSTSPTIAQSWLTSNLKWTPKINKKLKVKALQNTCKSLINNYQVTNNNKMIKKRLDHFNPFKDPEYY
jgi:hypothetical protein